MGILGFSHYSLIYQPKVLNPLASGFLYQLVFSLNIDRIRTHRKEGSLTNKLTYEASGVSYKKLDGFKRSAQEAARETMGNLTRHGFSAVEWTLGESCSLIDIGDSYLGHVEEGLGTKNLVADALRQRLQIAESIERITGKSYYAQIAQDTVAAIVNDMITLGVLPLSVAMHLGVGASEWFEDTERYLELIEGWKQACMLARCAWGGGETSTLKGVISPNTAILSGSAIGIVKPKERLITPNIQHGDAIVLVGSSGIHSNGLTMAREIADKLPSGYLTKMDDGRIYGEALLDPTPIYVALVEDCLDYGVEIHGAVNVTGHGWRKLMRATQPFAYIIEELPKQLPIFEFIQQQGPVDDEEAYGNLNMGAGFALYVPKKEVAKILNVLHSYEDPNRFTAHYAGYIEKSVERKVIIRPKKLEYRGSTLDIR